MPYRMNEIHTILKKLSWESGGMGELKVEESESAREDLPDLVAPHIPTTIGFVQFAHTLFLYMLSIKY